MFSRNFFLNFFVLIAVGAALGVGYNLVSPKPVPWTYKAPPTISLDDDADSTAHGDAPPETAPPVTGEAVSMAPDSAPEPGEGHPSMAQVGSDTPPDPDADLIPPAENLYPDIPESEFPIEAGINKIKRFYDRGGLLVLDSRESTDYAMGHIKGALSTPHDEYVADVEWLDATAQDPRPIMIYCDGGDCELSINLAFALCQSGHRKVLVFKEGYPAWEDAGYPTVTGDQP